MTISAPLAEDYPPKEHNRFKVSFKAGANRSEGVEGKRPLIPSGQRFIEPQTILAWDHRRVVYVGA